MKGTTTKMNHRQNQRQRKDVARLKHPKMMILLLLPRRPAAENAKLLRSTMKLSPLRRRSLRSEVHERPRQ